MPSWFSAGRSQQEAYEENEPSRKGVDGTKRTCKDRKKKERKEEQSKEGDQ